MKQNYKNYLNKILDERDIEILMKIKKAGSNTCYDLMKICCEYSDIKYSDLCRSNEFSKKLNKFANYGLLRKMGIAYSGEEGAYFCISSDGLKFLEN